MPTLRARLPWSALAAILFLFVFAGRGLGAWFWQDDFFWLRVGSTGEQDLLRILFAPKANGNLRPWSENLFFYGMHAWLGPDPLPFRIVVFATIACDLWLVDTLVRHLTGSKLAATVAAVCWLVNPCMATVYTWTTAYNQVCYLAFLLAGLLLFIRGRYVAQTLVFVAGLGALETAMMYPALVAAYALLYDRANLWRALPLAAIATAYFALHWIVAPPRADGPYRLAWDLRILQTLWTHVETALGPQQLQHHYWAISPSLVPAGTAAMLILLGLCVWASPRPGLFGIATFLALLAPVLPLPHHVMQYYLTGPTLGLSVSLAAATAASRRTALWRAVAWAAVACYVACAAPAAWQSTTWHLARSALARDLVVPVVTHARAHPGQTILLTGMSTDQFVVGFADRPFTALGVPDVFLAPGAEQHIADPWNAAPTFVLPISQTLSRIDAGTARVLDVGHGTVRDVTAAQAREWRTSHR